MFYSQSQLIFCTIVQLFKQLFPCSNKRFLLAFVILLVRQTRHIYVQFHVYGPLRPIFDEPFLLQAVPLTVLDLFVIALLR